MKTISQEIFTIHLLLLWFGTSENETTISPYAIEEKFPQLTSIWHELQKMNL
ncbi:MAG: hypothetical protein AB4080_01300 [Trichodesmium sp.]